MGQLALFESTAAKLSVFAQGVPGAAHFDVALLKLTLDGHAATLRIEPLAVPLKLLRDDAGTHRFRSAAELEGLAVDEWAALRARLRERLSLPFKLTISSLDEPDATRTDFFGVGSADLSAGGECLISPAVIDGPDAFKDGDWVVKLSANGSLTYKYELAAGKPITGEATLKFDVTVIRQDLAHIADAVRAVFDIDLPKLPGFDLQLHFPMPQLKFDFPAYALPDDWLPSFFDMALPSFGRQLAFKLSTAPKFSLQVNGKRLSMQTANPGEGDFTYVDSGGNPVVVASVTNIGVSLAEGKFAFTASIAPKVQPVTVRPPKLDYPWLPVIVDTGDVVLQVEVGTVELGAEAWPKFSVSYTFNKLSIQSRDEADLFITLKLELKTSSNSGGGLDTEVTTLEIIEPYPIKLIGSVAGEVAKAVGQLIRLIGPVQIPATTAPNFDALQRFLKHLARMMGAALAWLAKQAGEVAGLLAGLLETVAKALANLVEAIAKAGASAFSHLVIEVRLDPKTFRLRQIVVQSAGMKQFDAKIDMSALGFDFVVDAGLSPALVLDFGPEQWFGLVVQPKPGSKASMGTDLWLSKDTGPSQSLGTLEDGADKPKRLIQITAEPRNSADSNSDLVVVAFQRGQLRLFQRLETATKRADPWNVGPNLSFASLAQDGRLVDATIGIGAGNDIEVKYTADAEELKKRALALMPKSDDSEDSAAGGGGEEGILGQLKQKIEITDVKHDLNVQDRSIAISFGVTVHLDKDFAPKTTMAVKLSLRDLSVKLTGGERIAIRGAGKKTYTPMGFNLDVEPKDKDLPADKEYDQFYLDLSHGGERLGLGEEATALLSYGQVSSTGKGLQFEVPVFSVGRSGIDLEARILPEPVTLGGVDMPFRFRNGHIAIKNSQFTGGSLTGDGQLPDKLIGEANASIALSLGAENGSVVVEAATATIDKSGDPIRCTSTQFDLTITELGLGFVREGGYHFYFMVTGSASFNPGNGSLSKGLLKNFGGVEIKLDKAPLAGDARVLARAISFKVKIDPVKTLKAFSIFTFEWRSFGYHPACDKFGGDPAISIGGQMRFMQGGDKTSVRMDFHDLWVSFGKGAPRFRCDGLAVGLSLGGVKVEGSAIAVDGSLPSLYKPGVLPSNVTAHGFLASGRIQFPGWSPLTAAMGFLELRKAGSSPRHAFFIYGQQEKQTEPIDTPVGRIYLREYGFGFGYRYTLAGIARAETAKSPSELIKILDEVSKFQGSLDQFQAWEPTYDNADLTIALRGMLSMAAASERGSYNADKEAELPNPLLLDIVAALRTDLTFLINVRAWVAVNYHDWTSGASGDAWRNNPTMRGYLYFSVPRKEFLGRFIADKQGHVGVHPKLPDALMQAIRGTDFSATLYIRPGLFHFEMGWPFELGVQFGKPSDNFYLKLNGGLIHRIEDFSVLYGMAFKAVGSVHLEGRVGSDSFGASAVAHADFAILARILAFVSLRSPGDSMFYGELRIDITVRVSVQIWLSFKVFGHRIRLSQGFSLDLAVSLAIEAVLSASKGLGGKAHASISVRAFGRSASLGIGFSFNDSLLTEARARVARYSAMGLTAEVPDRGSDGSRVETNPPPPPSRSEVAAIGDQVVDNDLGKAPPAPVQEAEDVEYTGRAIGRTDFWAMLFPTAAPQGKTGEWYVMQMIPRDHTQIGFPGETRAATLPSTFYAAPRGGLVKVGHSLKAGAALPGILHAAESYAGQAVAAGQAAPWDEVLPVNLGAIVQREDKAADTSEVKLETILTGLFLDRAPDGSLCGEPRPRVMDDGMVELEADTEASARTLARAGRTRDHLDGLARREAQIEEARSAVLASVAESAAKLAAQGLANGIWPARHDEIDARDFGLTFVLDEDAVRALFGAGDEDDIRPRTAKFTIEKTDSAEAGEVLLFNPPERMFRRAQPAFLPTHTIEPQGIKLDWDLEPHWGRSVGAYHDPEFHLKHYRILRIVRGYGERELRAEFVVKAASATSIEVQADRIVTRATRPPFQFIDDLRKQESSTGVGQDDIPAAVRDVLLGQGTLKGWKDANGPVDPDPETGLIAGLEILYQIVPVDYAGTSGFGESYVVRGFGVRERPLSPREATLQIEYAQLPAYPGPAVAPALRLLVRPGVKHGEDAKPENDKIFWPEKGQVFHLRILSEPARASGAYGTDAIDVAGRQLDERAIEALRGDGVSDFILIAGDRLENGNPDPGALAAEYKKLGEEKPVVNRYPVTVRKLGAKGWTDASLAGIAQTLGSAMKDDDIGRSHRLFMRLLKEDSGNAPALERLNAAGLHGEWRTVKTNLVIKHCEETKISALVEEFEQPVDIAFKALRGTDLVEGESGRVHLLQPAATASLADLLAGTLGDGKTSALAMLRDPLRRSAARLTWRARPDGLRPMDHQEVKAAVPAAAEMPRWVGGFDLHVVDADGVPAGMEPEKYARHLGRVNLLPPSMAALEPSGFGDFGNLESAYPSDTLRQQKATANPSASGMRRAPWFSLAESTALFPQPAVRRSLLPDPDEDQLAALFAKGAPGVIRVVLPAWNGKDADPFAAWTIVALAEAGAGPLASLAGLDTRLSTPAAAGVSDGSGRTWIKSMHFGLAEGGGTVALKIAAVRDLLQRICLQPDAAQLGAAYSQEERALERRLGDPRYLAAVTLRVEALHLASEAAAPVVLAFQDLQLDLLPALHPVLGDALALLAYPRATDPGQCYRRYSVVPDAVPPVSQATFGDWLDANAPERDPHGWGALRTLGLASGFRLYDTETGVYLSGHKLLDLVNSHMARALGRYDDSAVATANLAPRFNGQPFVDLLTRPWGNARLFWFDGGYQTPSVQENRKFLNDDVLAVVQIALRPAPDRLAPDEAGAPGPLVFYFAASCIGKPENPQEELEFISVIPAAPVKSQFRFDVLSVVDTLAAHHPQRISATEPYRFSARLREHAPFAVLRAVRIRGSGGDPAAAMAELALLKADGQPQAFALEAMDLATLDEQDRAELAFGKFSPLDGADWADALFRPDLPEQESSYRLAPVAAYARLAYYAGRRFAPLVLKQGARVEHEGKVAEAEDVVRERADLTASLARFWLRFVEHCAIGRGDEIALSFSLGTVADPGEWRCAPDSQGNVSVLIPDADRRGARRKYAVRPYGRYDGWVRAVEGDGAERRKTLHGALDGNDVRGQFLDITLPRTEPLEKPVILSAVRQRTARQQAGGRLELVIAHGQDMVLAQANMRNDAQIASLDMSVGFWREFPHRPWLAALEKLAEMSFDAMAPFGSIEPATPAADAFPPLNKESARSRLVELRQRVPDAWMGTTVVSAVPPPYFFKVHALVHACAGIIVSEQTASVFQEGAATLCLPHDREAGYRPRTPSAPPVYSVGRDATDGVTLLFDLPLLRFIDCMHVEEAELWFGDGGAPFASIAPVAHLPEPGVSYRVGVETVRQLPVSGPEPQYESLARQPEIEILPAPPAAGESARELYMVTRSGSRFGLDQPDTKQPLRIDPGHDDNEWRIQVPAALLPAALSGPVQMKVAEADAAALKAALAELPRTVPAAPRVIDGLVAVRLRKDVPSDDWAELMAAARAVLVPAPEALDALLAWQDTEPGIGAVLSLPVPDDLLDAALPALRALCPGGEVTVDESIGLLVLRLPPTDDELLVIGTHSAALAQALFDRSARHLFGDGRRLLMTAMKGEIVPVSGAIVRKPLSWS